MQEVKELNSLAEVRRLCTLIITSDTVNFHKTLIQVSRERRFYAVPMPFDDFLIDTNGDYYLVTDKKGSPEYQLYKLRT